MSIPAAIVRIRLRTLRVLEYHTQFRVVAAKRAYALAFIGRRRIGRSRVVKAVDPYDFDEDVGAFTHEVRVAAGEVVAVRVEVWDPTDERAPIAEVAGTVAAPWLSGPRTATTDHLAIGFDVFTRRVGASPSAGVVARAAEDTPPFNTLLVRDQVVVEIVDVDGLYEPDPRHADGEPNARRRRGYTSEDDKGRVYINRDLAGKWTKDLQLVEVHARVTAVSGFMPDNARVRWTVLDADDPSNDDPTMHEEAGRYVDRADYDPNTGEHRGARAFDNEGQLDRDPRFEEVGPFTLEQVDESEARSLIVLDPVKPGAPTTGQTKVRIHCPNVAGDNLIVRAEVIADTSVEVFAAETGIMSMWNRIDVEYVRMKNALPLPVDGVPRHFEPAFAQLDFAPERVVADQPTLGKDAEAFFTTIHARSSEFFAHEKDPGWFCVLAANLAYPKPSPGPPLYSGDVMLSTLVGAGGTPLEMLDVPGEHHTATRATLRWGDPPVSTMFDAFFVDVLPDPSDATKRITRFQISPHSYWPYFRPNNDDGPMFQFGPRFGHDGQTWRAGGYGVPTGPLSATIQPEAEYTLRGLSLNDPDAGGHTMGRTFVLTHALDDATGKPPANVAARLENTLVHELAHDFDLGHNCGYWDHRTERKEACASCYDGQWRLVLPVSIYDGLELALPLLESDTGFRVGARLCGRHVYAIRRVRLEDNPALGWK
jgi:hypothetical protein